jgi:ABC-type transport system involved in cytochrome c biogenesis permease component
MALSHKARKRWALVILLIGLPVYIVVAVTAVNAAEARLGRPVWWLEFLIYIALGIVWALPFRAIFRGLGRADPDEPPK